MKTPRRTVVLTGSTLFAGSTPRFLPTPSGVCATYEWHQGWHCFFLSCIKKLNQKLCIQLCQWLGHLILPDLHSARCEGLKLSSCLSLSSHTKAVKPFRSHTITDGVPQVPAAIARTMACFHRSGPGECWHVIVGLQNQGYFPLGLGMIELPSQNWGCCPHWMGFLTKF